MNEMVELKERFEGIAKSAERFPVDFNEAWQWVGYSQKGHALEALKSNFEENLDFLIFSDNRKNQVSYESNLIFININVEREIGATPGIGG